VDPEQPGRTCKQTRRFQLFQWVSRACLGKHSVFSINWRKKRSSRTSKLYRVLCKDQRSVRPAEIAFFSTFTCPEHALGELSLKIVMAQKRRFPHHSCTPFIALSSSNHGMLQLSCFVTFWYAASTFCSLQKRVFFNIVFVPSLSWLIDRFSK
jgi:hypothetical protein